MPWNQVVNFLEMHLYLPKIQFLVRKKMQKAELLKDNGRACKDKSAQDLDTATGRDRADAGPPYSVSFKAIDYNT